jgi:hypothetical protein
MVRKGEKMNCIKDGKYTGNSCFGCKVKIEDCEIRDKVYRKRWIPCSERLPENSDWYLVTKSFLIGDGNEVSLLWYGDIGNGYHFYCEELPVRENIQLGKRALEFDCLVIAWQPKPEKYVIK